MVVDVIMQLENVERVTSELLDRTSEMDLDELQQAISIRDKHLTELGDLANYPVEHHAAIAKSIQRIAVLNKTLLQHVTTRQVKLSAQFSALKSANKAASSYLK
jgi:hypothetical protein